MTFWDRPANLSLPLTSKKLKPNQTWEETSLASFCLVLNMNTYVDLFAQGCVCVQKLSACVQSVWMQTEPGQRGEGEGGVHIINGTGQRLTPLTEQASIHKRSFRVHNSQGNTGDGCVCECVCVRMGRYINCKLCNTKALREVLLPTIWSRKQQLMTYTFFWRLCDGLNTLFVLVPPRWRRVLSVATWEERKQTTTTAHRREYTVPPHTRTNQSSRVA